MFVLKLIIQKKVWVGEMPKLEGLELPKPNPTTLRITARYAAHTCSRYLRGHSPLLLVGRVHVGSIEFYLLPVGHWFAHTVVITRSLVVAKRLRHLSIRTGSRITIFMFRFEHTGLIHLQELSSLVLMVSWHFLRRKWGDGMKGKLKDNRDRKEETGMKQVCNPCQGNFNASALLLYHHWVFITVI